jgi:alkylation response protein AidB-like acyl-CoA dehydrogenase
MAAPSPGSGQPGSGSGLGPRACTEAVFSTLPYCEPYWYHDECGSGSGSGGDSDCEPHHDAMSMTSSSSLSSPYYSETHIQFRNRLRCFVDKELLPYVLRWDEDGKCPQSIRDKAWHAGILGAMWPTEYGGTPPNVTVTGPDAADHQVECDVFHQLILCDELARCCAGGVLATVFFGFGIALKPILSVGSRMLRDKVALDVISGKKTMALAMSEPHIGNDANGLRTIAVIAGDEYIVNGMKRFITCGMEADYIVAGVRIKEAADDGDGFVQSSPRGVSLILLHRDMPGIKLRQQPTQGWWASSTAYITFENVRVPRSYLIGKRGQGFRAVLPSFNLERFTLSVTGNRYARCCLEDAIKFARRQKSFGRCLIDYQVVRHKLMHMAMRIESTHDMIERAAYQLHQGLSAGAVSGTIALLKIQCIRTLEFCVREASQILGSASCQRGGIGGRVERLCREVRVLGLGGGSEQAMFGIAAKRAKL